MAELRESTAADAGTVASRIAKEKREAASRARAGVQPRPLDRVPTLEEAEAQIEAEWEADRQGALTFHARRLIAQHEASRREQVRDQRLEERAERERAETAKGAAKAWRKLYGRSIARALEPWVRYTVVDVDGTVFACSIPDRIDAARDAARDRVGNRPPDIATDVLGVELSKTVRSLDGVNPDDDTLAAIVEARDARESARSRREAAKRDRERREERERRQFGVTVSDVDDDED
ncbi:MAG TPA: hypothetical protein VNL97_00690 [Solirubrobacterales bacterium]|nr:hypothetical protein [Solirubrobacterales bacterium]